MRATARLEPCPDARLSALSALRLCLALALDRCL